MKNKIFTAALLCAFSAQAETIGYVERMLPDSSVLKIALLDTPSNHPYCGGQREATSSLSYGTTIDQPYARGCWHVVDADTVAVDTWTLGSGDSATISLKRKDFWGPSQLENVFGQQTSDLPAAQKPGRLYVEDISQAMADSTTAGACFVISSMREEAKTESDVAFVERIEETNAKLAGGTVERMRAACASSIKSVQAFNATLEQVSGSRTENQN
ncbi:hypothetical protein ACRTIQ_004411 [Escherichia coli]